MAYRHQRIVRVRITAGPARSGRRLTGFRNRLGDALADVRLRSGLASGLLAGLVLSAAAIGAAVARGDDPWGALKLAAFPFIGARALQPGPDALAAGVGLLAHLAVSMAWGVPFALCAHGVPRPWIFVGGAIYGLLVWSAMHGVAVPSLLARPPRLEPLSIAAHVLFGLALATGVLWASGERPAWPRRRSA